MYVRCISVDWPAISKAIGLSEIETAELFADGRVSGELLQRIAIRQFNLIPANNCDLYDAIFPESQEKIEIRLITRNGIQTRPSNQIGAKREFNRELYMKKLESVEYFLFVDLRTVSNTVPCYLVPSAMIRKFFITGKLGSGGATSSNKTIGALLMESVRLGWDEGLRFHDRPINHSQSFMKYSNNPQPLQFSSETSPNIQNATDDQLELLDEDTAPTGRHLLGLVVDVNDLDGSEAHELIAVL
jgi:hypothetical protein